MLRWWEKTVEYEFVMLMSREKKLFLAPLDGPHETAGDAILSSNNYRWVLIEFKKDASSIRTEKKKFIHYAEAKEALSSRDSHHHIIFGQQSSNDLPRLKLCTQTYFSETVRTLNEILKSGEIISVFKEYVQEYMKFKKGPRDGSGTGLTMDDFALVAGVTADNNIVECLSFSEFQKQMGLEHTREKTQSRGFGLSR